MQAKGLTFLGPVPLNRAPGSKTRCSRLPDLEQAAIRDPAEAPERHDVAKELLNGPVYNGTATRVEVLFAFKHARAIAALLPCYLDFRQKNHKLED
jgi:hypothetical protein